MSIKKLIIWSSIIGIFLLVANLICPFIWFDATITPVVTSIISGWVSGLATLFVGIFAALQAKKYKEANDAFIEKQYKLEKSTSLIHARLLFVDNLKRVVNSFGTSANPAHFASNLLAISWNVNNSNRKTDFYGVVAESMDSFKTGYRSLEAVLKLDYFNTIEKDNVITALREYENDFVEALSNENLKKHMESPKAMFNYLVEELNKKFLSVMKTIDEYVLSCDVDINSTIANRNEDNDYIVSRYAPKNNELNGK